MVLSENNPHDSHSKKLLPTHIAACIQKKKKRNLSFVWERGYLEKQQEDKYLLRECHVKHPFPLENCRQLKRCH